MYSPCERAYFSYTELCYSESMPKKGPFQPENSQSQRLKELTEVMMLQRMIENGNENYAHFATREVKCARFL